MSGPILDLKASPTLANLLVSALKDISSPESTDEEESYTFPPTDSYFNFLRRYTNETEDELLFKPEVDPFVGFTSDHATFIYSLGLPVIDIWFKEDRKRYPNLTFYPAYHTGFDNFHLVDKLLDPEYRVFGACAQLNLRLGLHLAESKKLPFNLENQAKVMEAGMESLQENGQMDRLQELGVNIQHLNNSIIAFRDAAAEFDQRVATAERNPQGCD